MCLGFGGCGTVQKAPPEFLEDRFCELRVDGCLRSSASGRGTSKRKEGDVILLFPALPYEGVEFLQAEIPQRALLTVLGYERPKPREAEHLTLRVVGLYQTITVEEDALATIEFYLLLLVTHPWHKPQRHPPSPKFVGIASTPQVGHVVACVSVAQGAALWLQDGVEAGDEHVGGMSVTKASLTLLNTSPGELEA